MKEEQKGVFKKLIEGYNDTKISFINKMVNQDVNIFDENGFLDDGMINVRIESLKLEYKNKAADIEFLLNHDKNDNYRLNKIATIRNEQKQLEFDIAFLASNSFNNLELCINLLEGMHTDFKLCLYGLISYHDGNETEAFNNFNEYFKNKSFSLEHFLINKTYGKILYNHKQYKQSTLLLQKAIEKRPEDIELHLWLKDIYRSTGQSLEEKLEDEIIELLEDK